MTSPLPHQLSDLRTDLSKEHRQHLILLCVREFADLGALPEGGYSQRFQSQASRVPKWKP